MKFGIFYNTGSYGTDPDQLVAVARQAEACGFDSFYVRRAHRAVPGGDGRADDVPGGPGRRRSAGQPELRRGRDRAHPARHRGAAAALPPPGGAGQAAGHHRPAVPRPDAAVHRRPGRAAGRGRGDGGRLRDPRPPRRRGHRRAAAAVGGRRGRRQLRRGVLLVPRADQLPQARGRDAADSRRRIERGRGAPGRPPGGRLLPRRPAHRRGARPPGGADAGGRGGGGPGSGRAGVHALGIDRHVGGRRGRARQPGDNALGREPGLGRPGGAARGDLGVRHPARAGLSRADTEAIRRTVTEPRSAGGRRPRPGWPRCSAGPRERC